jgi:hypothetical protein
MSPTVQTFNYEKTQSASPILNIQGVYSMTLSRRQAIVGGIVLAIVALLSPFIFSYYSDVYETGFLAYTLLWTIESSSSGLLIIRLNAFWSILGYIPFVVFRLGVPVQFMRYYEKKTSGYSLAITGLAGEIPPLMMVLGVPLSGLGVRTVCPLPFHLLVCALIVLMKPVNYNGDVFHDEVEPCRASSMN